MVQSRWCVECDPQAICIKQVISFSRTVRNDGPFFLKILILVNFFLSLCNILSLTLSLIQTKKPVELAATLPHTELVERCKQGDPQSFRKLYELYNKAMFNTSFRILNDRAEAEDVLQESFIDAFKNIAQFENRSSFGSWLKQIVVNKSINVIRKRKMDIVDIEKTQVGELPEELSTVDEREIQWKVQEVRKAIQELPDGYRAVLTLYLLEGYDHEEISQILNVKESTARTQYIRAKQKLLMNLKNGGLS